MNRERKAFSTSSVILFCLFCFVSVVVLIFVIIIISKNTVAGKNSKKKTRLQKEKRKYTKEETGGGKRQKKQVTKKEAISAIAARSPASPWPGPGPPLWWRMFWRFGTFGSWAPRGRAPGAPRLRSCSPPCPVCSRAPPGSRSPVRPPVRGEQKKKR